MNLGVYRITERLGAGGMSEVWAAEHTVLERRVAIKLLRAELSHAPQIVGWLFDEARIMTALAHPGIVQVFDFGVHADGRAYIVMELLEGETLDRRLARLGALSVAEALHVVRQIATTLDAAHARGVVHRDVKPENIFLARDPEVVGGERAKILDFGIAKLLGERAPKTRQMQVVGTPTFMSPEQCRSAGSVDQRSDVYSLGCVLFALVTGRPPFGSDATVEMMAMHLSEPVPAPSRRATGIPPAIDQLVLRCMAKDPAERFTAGELARVIGELSRARWFTQAYGRADRPFAVASGATWPARRLDGPALPPASPPPGHVPLLVHLVILALLVSGVVWLAIVALCLLA